jgi:hypothetical protein
MNTLTYFESLGDLAGIAMPTTTLLGTIKEKKFFQ